MRLAHADDLEQIEDMLSGLDPDTRRRVIAEARADISEQIAVLGHRNDELTDRLVDLADEHLPGWDDAPDDAA